MVADFEHSTFAGRIGERFLIHDGRSASMTAQLMDAVPGGDEAVASALAAGHRAPFSIAFIGPREAPLAAGIYRVEHESLGTFELFLKPAGSDADGHRYEALFD